MQLPDSKCSLSGLKTILCCCINEIPLNDFEITMSLKLQSLLKKHLVWYCSRNNFLISLYPLIPASPASDTHPLRVASIFPLFFEARA